MSALVGKLKSVLVRSPAVLKAVDAYRRRRRPSFKSVSHLFDGAEGLEIGGPSRIFERGGPYPIYAHVGSLDNLNFSSTTFWSEIEGGRNFKFDAQKPAGNQFISDAVNLAAIADESYDLLISSHVIEHIANPLKALAEWKRVLRKDGILMVVAPDKRYTYDRYRPTTTFGHLVEDQENATQEDDRTHLDEIIRLHDLENDGSATSFEEHRERTERNPENRMAHHHVYELPLLREALTHVGFTPLIDDAFRPYHLLIVARKAQ
jgi:SAM-dependent methyltransferase